MTQLEVHYKMFNDKNCSSYITETEEGFTLTIKSISIYDKPIIEDLYFDKEGTNLTDHTKPRTIKF